MLIGLAVGCFPLIWWLLHRLWGDWRFAFLLACCAWGTVAVAMTEALSVVGMLATAPLAIAWAVVLTVALLLAWRRGGAQAMWDDLRRVRVPTLPAILLTLIILLLLLIAIVAAPNTWDSFTYHLPRVMHWEQNRTVAFYASNNGRQIHLPPGAEYFILHAQLLSGGDRFANCVQWMAMLGSVIGVSWIARALGASPRGEQLAALFCATFPMGVLQATSTQNDYAAAFWMLCFIAAGIELCGWALHGNVAAPLPRYRLPVLVAAMGLSLGLAILTKATAYVLLPPFMLWIALIVPMTLGRRVVTAAAILVIAGALNAGFFARNVAASGSPLGPGAENVDGVTHRYDNEVLGAPVLVSNVVRNLAIQFALPMPAWNEAVESLVWRIHDAIGAHPDDPRTTLTNQIFVLSSIGDIEDKAQGAVLLALALASTFTVARVPRPHRARVLACIGCIVVAFLLFCGYLKWQPWHTRLHLPLMVLLTAPVAVVIDQTWPRAVIPTLGVGVVVAALPVLLSNPSRPLVGSDSVLSTPRTSQYFKHVPFLQGPYQKTARRIAASQCTRVALAMEHDDPEYLLWVVVRERVPDVHIRHVRVVNYTRAFEDREIVGPDCALVIIDAKNRLISSRFAKDPGE